MFCLACFIRGRLGSKGQKTTLVEMQSQTPEKDSKQSETIPDNKELTIDESVPANRALLRNQARTTHTFLIDKLIRVSSEILKSTLISTIGSVMTGIQYLAFFKLVSPVGDDPMLDWFMYLLILQVYEAIALSVLMMTDISKLEMTKLNGKPLRVQLTALFAISLLLMDITIETSKGLIMAYL